MTFSDVVKLGAAIVAGMGGGGAIALGLASFFGKFWADKALEKERAEYQGLNTQLQHHLDLAARRLQIELDAVGLMHKLRTTEEFSHLGQLWKKMAWLSVTFNQACGSGLRLVPDTQEGMAKYKEERRKAYLTALEEAQLFFLEEELFIPEDIAKVANDTLMCAALGPYLYASFYDNPDPAISRRFGQEIDKELKNFQNGLDKLKTMMRARITGRES